MTDLYAALFAYGDVARALHVAVGHLRQAAPDRPSLWTPYIHLGP
jgi:hypothetical protein